MQAHFKKLRLLQIEPNFNRPSERLLGKKSSHEIILGITLLLRLDVRPTEVSAQERWQQ